MTSYWLGIDLGTTYTAAAICWPGADGLEVQVVPLSSHSHAIPSVLFLPGDGSLVVGEGAQRRSLTDPDRVVREFKSRVGDEIPLLVGGSAYYAHDLAAEFVGWLYHYVVDREGEQPEAVALTCPASWGPYKTALFKRAVEDAGVPNVMVLSEPQAAAVSYASREQVEVGATLAVYDLGGGTFDAAVVRKDSPTQFTVLGQPEGIAALGGLGFDELIFEHVCTAAGVPIDELDPDDPDLASEVARLRRECTEAKEALSADTDVTIPVTLGGIRQRVRLTRAEFEEMIRPDLDRTIDAMHRALATAQVEPGALDAILLIGGSSRIPLVSQLVAAEFGRPPAIDTDPKVAVAMGSARFLAPASAPVRDTLETAVQLPLDSAPPERPEMASMLDSGDDEEGGWAKPSQHPSRRVLAGAAALVVLVMAGGVTALRTPMLSDLLSHHGTTHGTTVSSGGSPGTGGSPAPSAQSSAKATSTARAGTTKTGANGTGPAASVASSKAAAGKTGRKGRKGGGGGGGGGTGGTSSPPVVKTNPPATPTADPPASPTAGPPASPTAGPPASPTADSPATPTADSPATPTAAATTGTGQGALPSPGQSASEPASA